MMNFLIKLYYFPTSKILSIFWSVGFILVVLMMIQVVTGMFLIFMMSNSSTQMFLNIEQKKFNNSTYYELSEMHKLVSNLLFFFLYVHMFRGIFLFKKNFNFFTWVIGVIILIIMTVSAFLGYSMILAQMGFWAGMVIISMLVVIPFVGPGLTELLWGFASFSTESSNRFLLLHFILSIMILPLILMHIMMLHKIGSTSVLMVKKSQNSFFLTTYLIKDIFLLCLCFLIIIVLAQSINYMITEPENYIAFMPAKTPTHITPEWYFLHLYTLLRSIASKTGGLLSIVWFFSVLLITDKMLTKKQMIAPFFSMAKMGMSYMFFLLLFLGAKPVIMPYFMFSSLFVWLFIIMFMCGTVSVGFINKV